MKKSLKIVAIASGIFFFTYLIVNATGIFQLYKSPTVANEPNLELNKTFYASNLKSPKVGDFVCYERNDVLLGKHVRVHKLTAMEDDIIEIKKGIVFINDINTDIQCDHMHTYQVSKQEFKSKLQSVAITINNYVYEKDENTIYINLKDSEANKLGLSTNRLSDEVDKIDKTISEVYKENWNKDNFGPLKIPKGKVFVLGDNRDNSEDSRYIGLVNKSDIVGVVLGN